MFLGVGEERWHVQTVSERTATPNFIFGMLFVAYVMSNVIVVFVSSVVLVDGWLPVILLPILSLHIDVIIWGSAIILLALKACLLLTV